MSDLSELLEKFRRGAEVLAVALTGVFGEEEDFIPAPGKWSARIIVAHLADSEVVCAHRLRQVAAEENATLVAFDQEAWARNLDYAARKPKQSLETFRRLRAENYALLQALPAAAFERTGNHTEAGPISLRALVERNVNHTEAHVRQLQGIRDAYKAAKGKK